jgi:hypothetical protein
VGGAAGVGGVRGQRETLVSVQGHGLEHQVHASDDGVMEVLDSAAVQAHVVGGPQGAELFASGGQVADQVGQALVERVASGFGAQQRDGGVGGVAL